MAKETHSWLLKKAELLIGYRTVELLLFESRMMSEKVDEEYQWSAEYCSRVSKFWIQSQFLGIHLLDSRQ